jgi:hypothetical protein
LPQSLCFLRLEIGGMGLQGVGVRAANALREKADLVRPRMCSILAGIAALAVGAFLGSQIPISPSERVGLETELSSEIAESKNPQDLPPLPGTSFNERFAGAIAPVRAVETEKGTGNELLLRPERATAHPAVDGAAPRLASVPSAPLAGAFKKRLRTTDLSTDLSSPPDVDSHTAIYDIAAHTVYLPDGHRLEAHSGLGSYIGHLEK